VLGRTVSMAADLIRLVDLLRSGLQHRGDDRFPTEYKGRTLCLDLPDDD
jgi:hypothetical protein